MRSERWELDKLGNWTGSGNAESPQGDPCVLEDTTIPVGYGGGPGVYMNPPCPNCVMSGLVPGHSVIFDEEGEDRQTVLWEMHGTESGVVHAAEAEDVLFSHQPNAIKTVRNQSGVPGAGAWNAPTGGSGSWRKQYTDPSGNLTFDGEYFYQYDAWNRLVQVNRSGNLTAWRFDRWGMPRHLEAGFIRPSSCGIPAELGALVKHQTYDGVGRLIRTSSPIQAPEGWEFEALEGGPSSAPDPWFTRSERFFYDGVRRIQEVVTDPILADGEGNRVATMSFENDNRNGHGGGGGSGGGGAVSVLPTVSVFLRAQYVWGPGDKGVDELLCQVEPDNSLDAPEGDGGANGHGPRGKPWYVLTDAQGDVASIVEVGQDLNGNPVTSVAGQWTYSPYGEILTYDELSQHPAVVFGHKTLVMDRLDGPTLTWQDESEPGAEDWTFFETRRLEPGARLIAYARNRTLDIQRGRWLQMDPNASGLSITSALVHHGQLSLPSNLGLSVPSRTGNGLGLYAYVGCNTVIRSDPTGLSFTLPDTMLTIAETALEKGQDLKKAGGLMFARMMLAKQMGNLYGGAYAVADGLFMEISGVGLGAAGGGMGLYKAVERLGGQNTGELLAFGQATFRENLTRVTGFGGQFMDALYHAHHTIPQAFRREFLEFGINVDNPIFGQWIREAEHAAMHAGGAYNQAFRKLLQTMSARGLKDKPAEALEFTMKFIRDEIVPNYKQYGLMPPF